MDCLALNTKDQHLESYDLSHLPIKVWWGALTGTKWEAQQQQQQRVQGSSFSYHGNLHAGLMEHQPQVTLKHNSIGQMFQSSSFTHPIGNVWPRKNSRVLICFHS